MTEGDRICTTIVQEIAAAEGADPMALPPLYDYIDIDALDNLLQSTHPVTVSFDYNGYSVQVTRSNEIVVTVNQHAGTADNTPRN